jgi:hypothetical protein
VLLKEETMIVDLPGVANAEWIHPNADEAGYYRWSLAPALNLRLARHAAALSPRERMGMLDNASALLDAGQLASDDYLTFIAAFAGDTEPEITQKVAGQLATVRISLVPMEQRERFDAFGLPLLRPTLTRIGLKPVAGEPDHVTPLRSTLLGALGRQGRDPEVIALARELTTRYLANPRDVDPALANVVLDVTAYHGDVALWETFRAAFEQAKSPLDRNRLIGTLGAVRDKAVVEQSLAYALKGPLNSTEFMRIPYGVAGHRGQRARVVDWVIQHFEILKTRMSDFAFANLIGIGEGDDPAAFENLRRFLLDPVRRVPAADPNITKATERMEQRALLRERESARIIKFLDAWPGMPPTDH